MGSFGDIIIFVCNMNYNSDLQFYHKQNKKLVTNKAFACWTSSLKLEVCQTSQKSRYRSFITITWPHVGYFIKGSCLGGFYTKSAPCLVWCPYIFCRWRYVFYLSLEPTRPLHSGVMHIYGWELFAACNHSEKFDVHGHSDN